MSNSLDPDPARRFVGHDLGPNCLQQLYAINTFINFRFSDLFLIKIEFNLESASQMKNCLLLSSAEMFL